MVRYKDINPTSPSSSIFIPVAPLIERSEPHPTAASAVVEPDSTVLGFHLLNHSSVSLFLGEQVRTAQIEVEKLNRLFPSPSPSVSFSCHEASILLILAHIKAISIQLVDSLNFIEDNVRSHFIAAIGQSLSPYALAQYMVYHNRHLFKEEFTPRPFCYSVRRSPQHSSEGSLSIERVVERGDEPGVIHTIVQHMPSSR